MTLYPLYSEFLAETKCTCCSGKGRVVETDHVMAGASVRNRRIAAGVTLNALADLSGLSRTRLSRLETGLTPWTQRTYNQVQGVLTRILEGEDSD